MISCHSVYSSPYPDPQNNTVPDGNSAICTRARVIADMRMFLVPEDRRDQKLTLAGRDSRPIEEISTSGCLPDWLALTTFVISVALILFPLSHQLFSVDPAGRHALRDMRFLNAVLNDARRRLPEMSALFHNSSLIRSHLSPTLKR